MSAVGRLSEQPVTTAATDNAIDSFRLPAALLVIAIHTSPLASQSLWLDFWLTRVLARVAVPFFFLISGYFSLPRIITDNGIDRNALRHFLSKTALFYAGSALLYLPLNIYAGHLQQASLGDILRLIFFEGSFYHLWYLPATMIGCLVVLLLQSRLKSRNVLLVCGLLYLLALGGDSYYGLIAHQPILKVCYDALLSVCGYTRNGLLMTPLFLYLGYVMRRYPDPFLVHPWRSNLPALLLLMLVEGTILHGLGWQHHDSMYLFLPLVMIALFQHLLHQTAPQRLWLRSLTQWLYLLHPWMIVLVRAAGKLLNLEALFIDNSLTHYILVCAASLVAAIAICKQEQWRRRRVKNPI